MTSAAFVPFLVFVFLLYSGVALAAGDSLLVNGSFEQSARCGNEAILRERGFDLGAADKPFTWPLQAARTPSSCSRWAVRMPVPQRRDCLVLSRNWVDQVTSPEISSISFRQCQSKGSWKQIAPPPRSSCDVMRLMSATHTQSLIVPSL